MVSLAFVMALFGQLGSARYLQVDFCNLMGHKSAWVGKEVRFRATYETDTMNYGYLSHADCRENGVMELVYHAHGDAAKLRKEISLHCRDPDIPCPVQVEVNVSGLIVQSGSRVLIDPREVEFSGITAAGDEGN